MSKQYNVMFPKAYERNGKSQTSFVRVGTAFPLRDRDGFSIEFDVPLVLAGGDCKLVMFVREMNDGESSNRSGGNRGGRK